MAYMITEDHTGPGRYPRERKSPSLFDVYATDRRFQIC
jgi:hypothetical protein